MRQLRQAYQDLRIVAVGMAFILVTILAMAFVNIIIAMLIGGAVATIMLELTAGPLREHEPRKEQVKKLVYELVDPWEEFR